MSSKAVAAEVRCHFLALPLEIRREIYSQVFFDHPYSGKPSNRQFVINAMTLQRSEREIGLQTNYKPPPLHAEILRVCHACLREATPILCSQAVLIRDMLQDTATCVPSMRRLGARNLSLIREFSMYAWSDKLHQVWVHVCEIVDLMPELRELSIFVGFRRGLSGAQSYFSGHGADQARFKSQLLAPEACLVEAIKQKLRIHRHLSKIVTECESDESWRSYVIGDEEN
jgi:hypothetical protein